MSNIPAMWTPDCQGKQNFDGQLVTLSTRYWPRGGGFDLLTPERGWEGNDARPDIKPSAKATIYLGSTEDDFYDDAVKLAVIEVEADTEAEVKAQVEAWVTEQYARIGAALRALYGPRPTGSRDGGGGGWDELLRAEADDHSRPTGGTE